MYRRIASAFVLLSILCVASPDLLADERPSVELVEEQAKLNDQAVEALISGNPARAVALLEEAISLGPNNITAFNLARAYHSLGECDKARAAYEKSLEAPVVSDPPPQRIREKAKTHLAELDEECTEPSAQHDEQAEQPDEQAVQPDEQSASDDHTSESSSSEAQSDGMSGRAMWGWTAVGTGVALGATSVGLHMAARSQRDRVVGDASFDGDLNTEVSQTEAHDIEASVNRMNTLALGAAITGGVVASLGAYLLMTEAQAPEGDHVAVSVGDDSVRLLWEGRF